MKLDRNINGNGRGKYGLINNRKLQEIVSLTEPGNRQARDDNDVTAFKVRDAVRFLENMGIIDWGQAESESEFFVIKLRDKYAGGALHTYASHAVADGEIEYGRNVMELAKRAGTNNPHCKTPD